MLTLDAIFVVCLGWLSRRSGWTAVHTLSVASGRALAYGTHAFLQKPLLPGSWVMARVGNAVFVAVAVVLIAAAAKRTARPSRG